MLSVYKLLPLSFFLIYSNVTTAQPYRQDVPPPSIRANQYGKNLLKGSVPSIFLIGAGTGTWYNSTQVRDIIKTNAPNVHLGYDDYLQYAPAAIVYGLNLANVKGRNQINRAATSHLTSLIIMGIIVNSIKYSTSVLRPDGSTKNSFPSGHTAMAFTNAGFLHKEYGSSHPFTNLVGYGAASLTAVGRVVNNRHWASDVLVGAGVGLISTELGYLFTDWFFEKKGEERKEEWINTLPSFLSLEAGLTIPINFHLLEVGGDVSLEVGYERSIKSAYFLNQNWGIGGDISFVSFPARQLNGTYVNILGAGLGPYFAKNIGSSWQLLLKASLGYGLSTTSSINETYTSSAKFHSMRLNGGLSFNYVFSRSMSAGFYMDYTNLNLRGIRQNVANMSYNATGLRLSTSF